jgi:hypothetical protein
MFLFTHQQTVHPQPSRRLSAARQYTASYISDEPESPATVNTSRILNCLPYEEKSKIGMYQQYVETEE